MINMPKDWDIDAEYHDVSSINEWRDIKEAAKKDPSLLEPGKASQLSNSSGAFYLRSGRFRGASNSQLVITLARLCSGMRLPMQVSQRAPPRGCE